jgi:hypothetical protein
MIGTHGGGEARSAAGGLWPPARGQDAAASAVQAIGALRDQQIQQVFLDLRAQLETQIIPKSWTELLEILALQKRRWALCLDEFSLPHGRRLVAAEPVAEMAGSFASARPALDAWLAGRTRGDLESFEKYACAGGIPKYLGVPLEAGQDVARFSESLYFGPIALPAMLPSGPIRNTVGVATTR